MSNASKPVVKQSAMDKMHTKMSCRHSDMLEELVEADVTSDFTSSVISENSKEELIESSFCTESGVSS